MRSILQSGSSISAGSSGRRACLIFIFLSGLWGAAIAQTNTAPGRTARAGQNGKVVGTEAAVSGSNEDPAAVERGGKLFMERCGECHGNSAKGTDQGPNLIYSLIVLRDEKGSLIAPILRTGRPEQGMPRPDLSEPQISDIVAWLYVQTYGADHRNTYAWLDVLTGDAKRGQTYFNTTGKCNTCHSVSGDLAGIGAKYDPFTLQSRWVRPGLGGGGGGRRGVAAPASARAATRVKVTLPSGESFSGALEGISDFSVSLKDASGDFHSFNRDGDVPKVEIDDPLRTHKTMLRQYTAADIHDVTAYLVALK